MALCKAALANLYSDQLTEFTFSVCFFGSAVWNLLLCAWKEIHPLLNLSFDY